jgi:hypothetical protein
VLHCTPDEAILDDGAPPQRKLVGYPCLQHLQPTLSRDHSTAEFEEGLEALLDRLELLIARRQPRTQPFLRRVAIDIYNLGGSVYPVNARL